MPIYEYWCNSCQRKVSLYQRGFSSFELSCPYCGGTELSRIFSTFTTRKTYRDAYNDILSDHRLVEGVMCNDSKALVEWNKRMSGDERTAPEYEEITERMARGQS